MFNLIDTVIGVINKVIPDPIKAQEARQKLLELQQAGELKELEQSANVVMSEAQGESFLQRNWRPITMLSFVAIVVNNYILYPYLSLFWHSAPLLPIPVDLWDLLKIGLGGYVVGRSTEKIVKSWADTKKG